MATLDPRQIKLHLPSPHDGEALDQDEEWCEVEIGGERRRIRFHDYASIYDVPGLYEQLFSELLECCSPDVVCELLSEELDQAGTEPGTLTALDFLGFDEGWKVGEIHRPELNLAEIVLIPRR